MIKTYANDYDPEEAPESSDPEMDDPPEMIMSDRPKT